MDKFISNDELIVNKIEPFITNNRPDFYFDFKCKKMLLVYDGNAQSMIDIKSLLEIQFQNKITFIIQIIKYNSLFVMFRNINTFGNENVRCFSTNNIVPTIYKVCGPIALIKECFSKNYTDEHIIHNIGPNIKLKLVGDYCRLVVKAHKPICGIILIYNRIFNNDDTKQLCDMLKSKIMIKTNYNIVMRKDGINTIAIIKTCRNIFDRTKKVEFQNIIPIKRCFYNEKNFSNYWRN